MNNAFKYGGPLAQFASITGSPLWGISVADVVKSRQQLGWRLTFGDRVNTPYGLGPQVFHFTIPGNGREIMWIPSYGMVRGDEALRLVQQERLFWVLWQAGVKVLLVGGTGGTSEWRPLDANHAESIRPSDVLLPWSFVRQEPMLGVLPGTGIGGLLPNLPRLSDPFCVGLSGWLGDRLAQTGVFRRVHRPSDVRVVLEQPLGQGSFETAAEIMRDRALGKLMSELDAGVPVVFQHGDCVSPLMSRHLGIHVAYYHIVANFGEGHPAAAGILTEDLDDLYVDKLPRQMLAFENDVLCSVQIPTDCTCVEMLKKRPDVYMTAMTNV